MLDKLQIFPVASMAGFHLLMENYVDRSSLTFLEMSYNDFRGLKGALAQTFLLLLLRYPTLCELSLG